MFYSDSVALFCSTVLHAYAFRVGIGCERSFSLVRLRSELSTGTDETDCRGVATLCCIGSVNISCLGRLSDAARPE